MRRHECRLIPSCLARLRLIARCLCRYVYGAKSDLTQPTEYHIDRSAVAVSFLPPADDASTPAAAQGSYHVSRLDSVVTADGVTGVSFSNLEIRHARGGGVVITDSTDVVLDKCTISDHGS